MAAAYAALLSLFHTLNHTDIHPRLPIFLDESQVESLTQNLTFLQHFLERYPSYEDDDLESRITAAAYAAEDVIETRTVDQIHVATSAIDDYGADLCGGLKRVIQDMDFIKRDVLEIIQQKDMMMTPQDAHLHTTSSVSTASTLQSSSTPVFDDAMIIQLLDKLVGQQRDLQIIPIVGMGGIGKTTLAQYIYAKPLILEHFDTLAWVTISRKYTRRNILLLLYQEIKVSNNVSSEVSEDEIGLVLWQHLCGRRYLIVMDDMWSIDAWDKVKSFFPDNNNGSRIMVTTRLSNLAFDSSGCYDFQMQFLDEDKSWGLLCEIVFGKLDCPIELENVGKEIAIKCRGLPLSISVVGGLLKKSNMTQIYWMYTLENLSFTINLENDEYSLRIMRTSYKELPMHLKPCFLYMGVFPEDEEIKTSRLIRRWVAERIVRPNDDKSLEDVAKEYLKELIDRNLILVAKLRWDGEAKLCKIHDLLRDVCLRESRKRKLFCVLRQQKEHTPQDMILERRICINPEDTAKVYSVVAMESASLTRSFLYEMCADLPWNEFSLSPHFRLLRVYSYRSIRTGSNNAIFEQANLPYLFLKFQSQDAAVRMLSLCSLLWSIQTLGVSGSYAIQLKLEIWKMPLLRHVRFSSSGVLPDPPNGEDNFVLKNLQTLSRIMNFKFSEEVVKRIPNIKKLKLIYVRGDDEEELPDFCLNNLGRLHKLESLTLTLSISDNCALEKVGRPLVSFPHSLKELTLIGTKFNWEELTTRIGSLPLLQFLKLNGDACVGSKWKTVEGKFCSLRLLEIMNCFDLKYWETDSAHFPLLEDLLLFCLPKLEEIPSCIGDISTLKSIRLDCCNRSAADSANRIKEEQEENGNEDLQVKTRFIFYEENEHHSEKEEEDEEDSEEDSEEEEDDEEDSEDENVILLITIY